MERGYIKINMEEGKAPSVEIQPAASNTVWLTKYEMARLLNCFPQKIEANLRSIFKEQLLWENDCTCNRRYTDGGIEKQCLYYNLEVLIFISYRVNTLEAKIFRQFVNTALREYLQREKMPKNRTKLVWLFQPPMNYSWN
ncbi:MAG: hypothetical protein LBS55_12845 [Prevotellaceae bacterium]|jgi:hypothetical protein|nr:hypothetical protein [Prevotellaceae bacterium]